MTTKLIAAPKQDVHQQDEYVEHLAAFPEHPPRGDMNNPIYIHESSHMRALAVHSTKRIDLRLAGARSKSGGCFA